MYKKFINSFMALSALTAFTNLQAVAGLQQNLLSSLTLNAASALTVSGDLAFSGTYYAGSNIPAATTSNVATITSTFDGAATGSTPVGQSVVVTGDANSINATSGNFQLFTTTGSTVSGTIPLSLASSPDGTTYTALSPAGASAFYVFNIPSSSLTTDTVMYYLRGSISGTFPTISGSYVSNLTLTQGAYQGG